MVTDHAIVCWLERVHGLDVRGEFVRQLLSQERADLAATMNTGRLRINDTSTVLYIRDGNVVAVWVGRRDGRPTPLPDCVRRASERLLATPSA